MRNSRDIIVRLREDVAKCEGLCGAAAIMAPNVEAELEDAIDVITSLRAELVAAASRAEDAEARAKRLDEALSNVLRMIGAAAGLKTEVIIPAGPYLADIVRGLKAEAKSAAEELPALRRQLAGAEALAARLQEENDRLRAEVRR